MIPNWKKKNVNAAERLLELAMFRSSWTVRNSHMSAYDVAM